VVLSLHRCSYGIYMLMPVQVVGRSTAGVPAVGGLHCILRVHMGTGHLGWLLVMQPPCAECAAVVGGWVRGPPFRSAIFWGGVLVVVVPIPYVVQI
jgi:hypothetical protein